MFYAFGFSNCSKWCKPDLHQLAGSVFQTFCFSFITLNFDGTRKAISLCFFRNTLFNLGISIISKLCYFENKFFRKKGESLSLVENFTLPFTVFELKVSLRVEKGSTRLTLFQEVRYASWYRKENKKTRLNFAEKPRVGTCNTKTVKSLHIVFS